MKLVENKLTKDIINKYIYIHKENKESNYYHIFKIKKIIGNNPITYLLDTSYYFSISKNLEVHCFCYEDLNRIEIGKNDEMYELTQKEFENTHLIFLKYDGKLPAEVPSKIIQDIVV